MGVNLAVFASHGGSGLQAIIDACESGKLDARVALVISNNSGSRALQRAKIHNIPAIHFSSAVIKEPHLLDAAVLDALLEHKIDIIFLAGYLKKLGRDVLKTFEGRVYNIHPSLLPKYGGKGMFGINVHDAVIAAGEKETGITIHKVNDEYDKGAIIAQRSVPVLDGDTPEVLAARVLQQEHVFIVEVLKEIIAKLNWIAMPTS